MIENTSSSTQVDRVASSGSPSGATEALPRRNGPSGGGRPWWLRLLVAVGRKAAVLVLVAVAAGLGYLIHRAVTPASVVTIAQESQKPDSKQKEQFWTCAMHPTVRLPRPGKCPI